MKVFKLSLSIMAIFFYASAYTQGVGVNTTGNNPDASAILDASSTSKGFLMPRMTTSQRDAIATPAEGLQIFNTTTKCVEFYVASHWQPISCSCPAIGAIGATISGPTTVCPNGTGYVYSIPPVTGATTYTWALTTGSGAPTITSANGNNSITVTAGTNAYNVSVTAANACGTSSATAAPLSVSINPVPSAPDAIVQASPSGTAVCQGQTAVTYTVTNVAGLTYNWTVPFGTITGGSTTNSITVTIGASASSGSVSVTATNSCGQTGPASTLAVTVNSIPSAPTANSAGSITATSLSANWASSGGATGYYLDVSTDINFGAGNFVSGYSNKDVSNVTTYSITGLTCNTTYYYRVRAYNTCGTSASSNTINVTSGACCNNTFSDNFNVSNQDLNGYNGWSVLQGNGYMSINSDFVYPNLAGIAYKNKGCPFTLPLTASIRAKNVGNGEASGPVVFVGASDVSNATNIFNTSVYFQSYRSDQNYANTGIYVNDGATAVAFKNTNFQTVNGGVWYTYTFTINADGSGTLQITDGSNSDSVSWGARTWSNLGGNYLGVDLNNGHDGLGQQCIWCADDYSTN